MASRMMKRKKENALRRKHEKALPPRRMRRAARLAAARHWLAQFTGKHISRAYSRWFYLDRLCAIKKLEILGVRLDPAFVAAVHVTHEEANRRNAQRAAKRDRLPFDEPATSNSDFAYIAGYTDGGAPFGVTWEEWKEFQ